MVLLYITLILFNSYSYIVLIVTTFLVLELSVCGVYYIWILSCLYVEKKEEIWLSPMTKAPTPTEMSKGQSDNTNNATKKFD